MRRIFRLSFLFASLTAAACGSAGDGASSTEEDIRGIVRLTNVVAGLSGFADASQHAFVARRYGDVYRLDYSPNAHTGTGAILQSVGTIGGISSHVTPDAWHHVVVAELGGAVREIYFDDSGHLGVAQIGTVASPKAITSWYSAHDSYQHVAVASANGDLTEIYYDPARGIFSRKIGNQGGTVSLAGHAGRDGLQHLFVLARFNGGFGGIYRFNWAADEGPSVDFVSGPQNEVGVATYAEGPSICFFNCKQHLLIATSDGLVRDVAFVGDNPAGTRDVASGLGTLTNIAAWGEGFAPTGHVVVSTSDGHVSRFDVDGSQAPYALASFPVGPTVGGGAPDLGCLPGGADDEWIDDFDAFGSNNTLQVIPPDDVFFTWDVSHGGAATSGNVVLDGVTIAQTFSANGAPTRGTRHATVDAAHLTRTLSLSGKCGTTSRSLTMQAVAPPPPAISSFGASPNNGYVTSGDNLTLSWSTSVSAHCGNVNVAITSYAQGVGPQFSAYHLPASGSVTFKALYDTKYTLTAQCTASGASASKDMQLYTYQGGHPPAGQYYCFKIVPPSVNCFTEAVYAPSESSAQSYEQSMQSPGSTVTSIDCSQMSSACN